MVLKMIAEGGRVVVRKQVRRAWEAKGKNYYRSKNILTFFRTVHHPGVWTS